MSGSTFCEEVFVWPYALQDTQLEVTAEEEALSSVVTSLVYYKAVHNPCLTLSTDAMILRRKIQGGKHDAIRSTGDRA